MATEAFKGWAVLELMGHRRLAGFVQEVELAGAGMWRIDIPRLPMMEVDPSAPFEDVEATQFYAPAAVYCLTPTTEEAARAIVERTYTRPHALLGLPAPVTVPPPGPESIRDWQFDDDPRDDDDAVDEERF